MPRNGSATSSQLDLFQLEKLTNEASSILQRMTSGASRNVISSPVSAAGPTPSDKPDGPIVVPSGPAPARVSRSRRQASKKALPTTGTSGPRSEVSLRSDALQSSLESRLRPLLLGSDLCEVIWKPWATPWGQCLSRPRAQVRTTSATDSGLWQTMVADDAMDRVNGKVNSRGEPKLSAQAIQTASAWPTPTSRDHKDGAYCPNVPTNGLLGRMVWPTPTSLAHAKDGNNEAGNSAGLVAIRKHAMAAEATVWPTARSSPNENRQTKLSPSQIAGKHGLCLAAVVQPATYPTPSAQGFEAKDPERLLERRAECKERTGNGNGFGLTLGQFACLNTNGSSEPTEKRGALNPEFVCWLMGYPTEWVNCAGSETRSTRGRQPPSSKQRKTR